MSDAVCTVMELPVISDARGALSFFQNQEGLRLDIRRAFWMYGIPAGTRRGGHAHRQQEQIVLMLAGQCAVRVDDGASSRVVKLCDPATALYVPRMRWLEMGPFSGGSLCLVLSSGEFDEADYIRDRMEFENLALEFSRTSISI